uniref:CAP-Gly domain-containing protein n=1 Tax=Glossina pallidipes TaxID=7398 RepID=A0A1A9ZAT9_GLOPL
MSMRMTTLHEEPFGGHRSLAEEAEDSYSDSEYVNGYGQERAQSNNISTNNYQNRSRLTSSKTMDSFMDVSTHTNYGCLNYASTTNAAAKQLTGLATPSMSSSTSSGYGSQAVSCTNLSNDDLVSMRSMNIEEAQDYDQVNSNSPPNRSATRVNPFLKDMTKHINSHKETILNLFELQEAGSQDSQVNDANKQMPTDSNDSAKSIKDDISVTNHIEESNIIVDEKKGQKIIDLQSTVTVNKNKPKTTSNNNNDVDTATTATALSQLIPSNGNNNKADNRNGNESFDDRKAGPQKPSGKILRRKKSNQNNGNTVTGAMYNSDHNSNKTNTMQGESIIISSNGRLNMSNSLENEDDNKFTEINLPSWVVVGESVLIRPYNTSGLIAYVGTTHFQPGLWIGVELDTPTGKNDGTVQGIQYFQCKAKHGIFVRSDKLILDKRGKAMRAYKAEQKQSKERLVASCRKPTLIRAATAAPATDATVTPTADFPIKMKQSPHLCSTIVYSSEFSIATKEIKTAAVTPIRCHDANINYKKLNRRSTAF